MTHLPADWTALCTMALLLGLQHGLDADHLAAIDGLTRVNSRRGLRFARWCGALFAGGHGLVVLTVAVVANRVSHHLEVPVWLEAGGSLFSITLLTLLGVGNLAAALRPQHGLAESVARGLRRIDAKRPSMVMVVGALFAVSFDTITQATVFALAAGRYGGVGYAAGLALLFVIGMLISDGLGGLWIGRLISRADGLAPLSSQVMTVSLAVLSLLVAAVGAARLVAPPQGDAMSGVMFGGLVLLLSGAGYGVAYGVARWGAGAKTSVRPSD